MLIKKSLLIFVLFFTQISLSSQNNRDDNWWKHTSIYQVYPRSFYDSNGDGIGDIEGIILKLDYIHQLGFETIWFSPFFKSPHQDFGYDISDYKAVDPVYGKSGDIETLINEVHKRDMKILFDLVLNHSSIEHPWFIESLDSSSSKADWYIWKNGRGTKAPNNWKNMTGQKGWQYQAQRGQWYWSSFLPFQADLNWRNPEVKESMFNTIRYWLDKGVDGFRLDIFNVIIEDSMITKNPYGLNFFPGPENPAGGFQRLRNNFNLPENYQIALELRKVLNEYKNRFLIGEVFGKHEVIRGFLGQEQDGLHSIFLFDFMFFDFSTNFFKTKIKTFETHYPPPNVPVYVYSNHDNRRSIGRIHKDINKAKIIAFIQLTARGIAVVYQGEEFGSSDTRIKRKDALDPVAELFPLPQFIIDRMGRLVNRDECRTPIQWSNGPNGGFSRAEVKTWLPVNSEYTMVNSKKALGDSNSLIYVYKNLLKLRKENPVLKSGTAKIIENKELPGQIYLLERQYEGKKLWIIVNLSNKLLEFNNLIKAEKILYQIGPEIKISPEKLKISGLSAAIVEP